jgi:hypothetical protein
MAYLFPAATALLMLQGGLLAQEPRGWIEGTVLNKYGKVVWDLARQSNIMTVRAIGPSKLDTHPDTSIGNFYTIRDLKPGIYEIFVSSSKDDETQYRPQHIMGLVVKPGVRTVLNIVVHEGKPDAVEEIGKAVSSENGMTLLEMVERLNRDVEVLKKQVAELKK